MGKKLAFAVYVNPSDDPDNPFEGKWYQAGEELDSEHEGRVGDHVFEPDETDDDEDGNAVLRQNNVPLRELKKTADELGIDYPKNVGQDALTQAIRYAQGRQSKGDTAGSTESAKEQVESAFTGEAWQPIQEKTAKSTSTTKKGSDTNDAAGS